MLTAYLDESGIEGEEHVVVAGFIGEEQQWKDFAPRWIAARSPKQSFHAKELNWRKPQRTKAMLERLAPIPTESGLFPVYGIVRVSDFCDLVPTSMRPRFKGYLLATYAIVSELKKTANFDIPFAFVMEEQQEYEVSARKIFNLFSMADLDVDKITITYTSKKSCVCFEPCDFLAFALLQSLRDQESKKAVLTNPVIGNWHGAIGEYVGRQRARNLTADLVRWIRDGRICPD